MGRHRLIVTYYIHVLGTGIMCAYIHTHTHTHITGTPVVNATLKLVMYVAIINTFGSTICVCINIRDTVFMLIHVCCQKVKDLFVIINVVIKLFL